MSDMHYGLLHDVVKGAEAARAYSYEIRPLCGDIGRCAINPKSRKEITCVACVLLLFDSDYQYAQTVHKEEPQ